MGYNLQVVSKQIGVNFNCKYENMSKDVKPEIVAKSKTGVVVKERSVYNGTILREGDTNRMWCDDEGNFYAKDEIVFTIDGEQLDEKSKTECFDIQQFDPLSDYTNKFVINKYYELSPSNNGKKSDHDRKIAMTVNLDQMRKIWVYLHENQVVGRAEFNVSSKGFKVSYGYLRAISVDESWGLEIGLFSEKKIFHNLQKETEFETASMAPTRKKGVSLI